MEEVVGLDGQPDNQRKLVVPNSKIEDDKVSNSKTVVPKSKTEVPRSKTEVPNSKANYLIFSSKIEDGSSKIEDGSSKIDLLAIARFLHVHWHARIKTHKRCVNGMWDDPTLRHEKSISTFTTKSHATIICLEMNRTLYGTAYPAPTIETRVMHGNYPTFSHYTP